MLNACTTKALWWAGLIKQTRWHQRKQCKANNCQTCHGSQGIAIQGEHIFAATKENQKHTDGDCEVRGPIEGVQRLEKPFILQEPLLDGLFVIQTHGAFHANDFDGIVEGVKRNVVLAHFVGSETVAGQRVDAVEHGHDENLLPQLGAVLAKFVLCRRGGDCVHAPLILWLDNGHGGLPMIAHGRYR